MTSDPEKPASKPDPRYVAFNMLQPSQTHWLGRESFMQCNPTVYGVHADCGQAFGKPNSAGDTQRWLIDHLRQHVSTHGTIQEITIAGHGSTGFISSGNQDNVVVVKDLLVAIAALEKELGKKVTGCVHFIGCDTFEKLTIDDTDFFRNFSKKHQMQITGTMSHHIYGKQEKTRFVRFIPDGRTDPDPSSFQYIHDWSDYYSDSLSKNAIVSRVRSELLNVAHEVVSGRDPALREIAALNAKTLNILTDHHSLRFHADGKQALLVDDDGTITSFGDIPLSPMLPAGRESVQKILKDAHRIHKSNPYFSVSRLLEEGAAPGPERHYFYGHPFVFNLTKDEKKVIAVDREGFYCTFDLVTGKDLTPLPKPLTPAEEKAMREEIYTLLPRLVALDPNTTTDVKKRADIAAERDCVLANIRHLDKRCTSLSILTNGNGVIAIDSEGIVKRYGGFVDSLKSYETVGDAQIALLSVKQAIAEKHLSLAEAANHYSYLPRKDNGVVVALANEKHLLYADQTGRYGIFDLASETLVPLKEKAPRPAAMQQAIDQQLAQTVKEAASIHPERIPDIDKGVEAMLKQQQLLNKAFELDRFTAHSSLIYTPNNPASGMRLLTSDGLVLSYDGEAATPYNVASPAIERSNTKLVARLRDYMKTGLSLTEAVEKYNIEPLFTGSALVALKNQNRVLLGIEGKGFTVVDMETGKGVPQSSLTQDSLPADKAKPVTPSKPAPQR